MLLSFRRLSLASASVCMLILVLAACGSAAAPKPAAAATTFVGYKWTVVRIAHGGKTTPVPAGDGVYLLFAPNGDFGANEPVNYHGGTYTVTPGGFTTHGIYQTLVGSSGPPSVEVEAISAFGDGTRASAKVGGDTLTVTVNGYTLTTRRAGKQANVPAPR